MSRLTFKDLEHDGWTARAHAYDDWLAPVTRQAIDPILDALGGEFDGRSLLDICTGTGHLAGAAAARGAVAEGVDFAATMVEVARANYPAVPFRQADAEALPYPDRRFDLRRERLRALAPGGPGRRSARGVPHPAAGRPLRVHHLAAARAGLRPVRDRPRRHPPARHARSAAAAGATAVPVRRSGRGWPGPRGCGFRAVAHERHSCLWRTRRGADLLDLIYKSLVRAPMLIEHQQAEAKERVKADIVARAEAFRSGRPDRASVPLPSRRPPPSRSLAIASSWSSCTNFNRRPSARSGELFLGFLIPRA